MDGIARSVLRDRRYINLTSREGCGKADMKEEIELVATHCKHPDCCYRMRLGNEYTEFCAFCLIEGIARKCLISQCTRYKQGKRKVTVNKDTMMFNWWVDGEDW